MAISLKSKDIEQIAHNLFQKKCFFSIKTILDLSNAPKYLIDVKILGPRATQKRINEFILGRYAAVEALKNLIAVPISIGKGNFGEPQWPAGIVGSITHKDKIAVAVVSLKSTVQNIGIDLESLKDNLNLHIAERFCTKKELQWIHAEDDNKPSEIKLKMIFSAKESLYKMLFQWRKIFIAFNNIELTDEPHLLLFRVKFLNSTNIAALIVDELKVNYTFIGDYVFTFVILP